MTGRAEVIESIKAHGKAQLVQAAAHDQKEQPEKAARCRLRAKHAEEGYLLDQEEEYNDPAYAMGHQSLRAKAHEHGLVIGPDEQVDGHKGY